MFDNKKIFILGMARSGYEAALLLSKYNNKILITDISKQNEEHVKELIDLGVEIVITDNPNILLDDSYDYVIKNPGIKYDHACVLKANDLNIKVINEIEMAYSFLDKSVKIIGVTGSNGKTTTVTLIYEFLKQMNFNVHLCGNIGYPLSSMIKSIKNNDILVIEISDHQLCDMYNFKTDISVLTNISETHIDFHDSYDRYKKMKKRIFNNHSSKDLSVLNYNNEEVLKMTDDIASTKYYFSNDTLQKCYLKDNSIYYNNEIIVELKEIKISGVHNYENIMAAIIVCKEFNIDNDSIKKVLFDFNGVEHRIEYVQEVNNRVFYNDSKSTNNEATITALNSFNKPIMLIMGGLDRGQSFDELYEYMGNVKKMLCYGETKNRIKEYADKYKIECLVVENLNDATNKAYQESSEGDIILLSPGCASWDQYKCFEDRGNEFKNIVKELGKM